MSVEINWETIVAAKRLPPDSDEVMISVSYPGYLNMEICVYTKSINCMQIIFVLSFVNYCYYYLGGFTAVFSQGRDVPKDWNERKYLVMTIGTEDPMHEVCISYRIPRTVIKHLLNKKNKVWISQWDIQLFNNIWHNYSIRTFYCALSQLRNTRQVMQCTEGFIVTSVYAVTWVWLILCLVCQLPVYLIKLFYKV